MKIKPWSCHASPAFLSFTRLKLAPGTLVPAAPSISVKQTLSGPVEKLNELFEADLTDADALTFVQLDEHLAADARLSQHAQANDAEHYALGFGPAFDDALIDRVLKNQHLFAKLQDDPRLRKLVADFIRPRVYRRQREGSGTG